MIFSPTVQRKRSEPIHATTNVYLTAPPQLATDLLDLSSHFTNYLRPRLVNIPPELLSLPSHLAAANNSNTAVSSPIVPLMTSHPRPLSAYLLALGMNARPITWPTVPKGKDRVRVCLHAGNTVADVEKLAQGALRWAEETMAASRAPRQGFVTVESKL